MRNRLAGWHERRRREIKAGASGKEGGPDIVHLLERALYVSPGQYREQPKGI